MDEITRISTIGELVAANLRRIRSVTRMPQTEIAGRMAARGWPWTAAKVSLTESGKRGLTLDEVADLCASLEMPIADLLNVDGLDVTDEVRFRAQVLSTGRDPWGFSTSKAMQDAAAAAKRVESLRRIEGRIARSVFGSDTNDTRAQVADLASEMFEQDVLAKRDERVGLSAFEAHEAGVYVESHVLKREATSEIIHAMLEELEQQ